MAEVPKDGKDGGKEEEDELAEYELDKYDEEDVGERIFFHYAFIVFRYFDCVCLNVAQSWTSIKLACTVYLSSF